MNNDTYTFTITVAKRDDLPDAVIDNDYVKNLLLNGAWLDVLAVEAMKGQNNG